MTAHQSRLSADYGLVPYLSCNEEQGLAMGYDIIRDRVLTSGRPVGGRIVSIRLLEGVDEEFRVVLRVSWRQGEYLLAQRESNATKTYKNLAAIVRRCRTVYNYDGPILIETDQRTT